MKLSLPLSVQYQNLIRLCMELGWIAVATFSPCNNSNSDSTSITL